MTDTPKRLRKINALSQNKNREHPAMLRVPRSVMRANRRSPSGKCDRQAFAAYWCIAPTIGARNAVRISADRWPDHIRLSDLEPLFVCQGCGRRGADIWPDWDWDTQQKAYRTPIGARAPRATLRTHRRAFCALPLTRIHSKGNSAQRRTFPGLDCLSLLSLV